MDGEEAAFFCWSSFFCWLAVCCCTCCWACDWGTPSASSCCFLLLLLVLELLLLLVDLVELLLVGLGGRVELHADEQRRVRAGAEALGDPVVRLAGGGALGQLAGVGGAELEVEHGRGQHDRITTRDDIERQGRAATPRAQRAQPCGWWSSGWVRPSFTRSELMR